jgi:hypothetical protein
MRSSGNVIARSEATWRSRVAGLYVPLDRHALALLGLAMTAWINLNSSRSSANGGAGQKKRPPRGGLSIKIPGVGVLQTAIAALSLAFRRTAT